MKRTLALLFAIALVTAGALAHGNEEHVMGVVTKISDDSITVETTAKGRGEKTTTTVVIVADTKFTKNDSPATLKDLKVGDRVVIHAAKKGDQLEAHMVRIGALKGAARPH